MTNIGQREGRCAGTSQTLAPLEGMISPLLLLLLLFISQCSHRAFVEEAELSPALPLEKEEKNSTLKRKPSCIF